MAEKEIKSPTIARRDLAVAIILSIITCGIYGIYWAYSMGKRMYEYQSARGENVSDNSVLYLVLTIFGFGIVVYALLQDTLNKYAE